MHKKAEPQLATRLSDEPTTTQDAVHACVKLPGKPSYWSCCHAR